MIEMIELIAMIRVPVPAGSGADRREFETESKPNRLTKVTRTRCRNIGTCQCFFAPVPSVLSPVPAGPWSRDPGPTTEPTVSKPNRLTG